MNHLTITATSVLFVTCSAFATPVTNWTAFDSQTVSGAATNSPTVGDGTDNSAAGHFAGLFNSSVTLAVGETLTVSGNLVLTGGTNDGDAVRWGIQNDGGQFALGDKANWSGGWLHPVGIDLFQARTNGNFGSTGGNAADLDASKTGSGTYDGDSVASFAWSMSITRDTATTVDIVSSFGGGDGSLVQVYTANDVTTSIFTYTATTWNFSSDGSFDQVAFSNVDVSVIPEPASLALFGLGGLLMIGRGRRSA